MTQPSTTHTPAYLREHYDLDALPCERPINVKNGTLVRVRKREYCLRQTDPSPRARWGTAEEISEDLAYLETYGTLPRTNGGPW